MAYTDKSINRLHVNVSLRLACRYLLLLFNYHGKSMRSYSDRNVAQWY